MILLSSGYVPKNDLRLQEIVSCLERNLAHPLVQELHLFLEHEAAAFVARGVNPALLRHPKLRPVFCGRRLTYAEYVAYANERLVGRPVGLINDDIYFDETLAKVERMDLAGTLVCLSRAADIDLAGNVVRRHEREMMIRSQDSWFFRPPLPIFPCPWTQGVPGCDSRFAFEAKRAGLKTINPALSVSSWHLHASNVRNYSEKNRLVDGGYLFLEPAKL